jgi:hypothetical protein
MKGSRAAELLPSEWSTVKWYLGRLNYVNLETKVRISCEDGAFKVQIKEISKPLSFAPGQFQGFVDEAVRGRSQNPVKFTVDNYQLTLTGFEIRESAAVVRFSR